MNFDQLIEPHLELIKRKHRSRVFGDLEGPDCHFPQAFDYRLQRRVTDWCSSDYLGMSEHPAVLAAMRDVIDQTGGSAGGTRDISEASRYRVLLEKELAELHGKESALLFTSGYVANEAAVSTLAGRISECIVFSDAANPASIIEGIQHSGAECQIFRHNDPVHLENRLVGAEPWRPKLVCFASVYPMDGDIAPVGDICDVADRYDAMTYLDEAHAVGIYGPTGGGLAERDGAMHRLTVIHGTLGKAFGLMGGYIAGSAKLIDFFRSYTPAFIFTTPLPPAFAAGALTSVRHLKSSSAERDSLLERIATVRRRLLEAALPLMPSNTHIVPIPMGGPRRCRETSDELLKRFGIYVQAVNYPAVPLGTERLCLTPTPLHSDEQIDHLVAALKEIWSRNTTRGRRITHSPASHERGSR